MPAYYEICEETGEQIVQALSEGPKMMEEELQMMMGKLGGKKQEFRTYNVLCRSISYMREETLKPGEAWAEGEHVRLLQ